MTSRPLAVIPSLQSGGNAQTYFWVVGRHFVVVIAGQREKKIPALTAFSVYSMFVSGPATLQVCTSNGGSAQLSNAKENHVRAMDLEGTSTLSAPRD